MCSSDLAEEIEQQQLYLQIESVRFPERLVAKFDIPAAPSTPGAQAAAEGQLTGSLRQLFALGEAYPDLKANTNFLALQEELSATEGRVAYARQFYNDSVLGYNNKLQQFPTMYFARALKFERREYFEADEAARTAPSVEF